MIRAILAVAANGAIGSNSTKSGLPWEHGVYPEDMKYFRENTLNNIVIMGRKTFEDVGILPKRFNYVITSQSSGDQGDHVALSMETFNLCMISGISVFNFKPTWVIGGKSIYEQLLPQIEEFHITRIADSYPDADVFMDVNKMLDEGGFTLVESNPLSKKCTVEVWR
ncbi:hypothetical protein KUA24_138 [Vibrio phage HNL01]|nr:hypothetical protein KUA24_138 [Vibrio phage HNL01]